MTKEELLKKLEPFPMDMEVCIYDLVKNEADASEEPSSTGVYMEFEVEKAHTDEELIELQNEYPETKNFIALSFNSEDK